MMLPDKSFASSLAGRNSLIPVKIRNAPKIHSTHSNFSTSATPPKMNSARKTTAPMMPQNSTRCWYFSGILKNVKMMMKTNRLSMLSASSSR